MNFLPIENLIYRTNLTPQESEALLLKIIDQKSYFLDFNTTAKPYKGRCDRNSFEVFRVLNYKNSFQPHIKGVVQESSKGVDILITMSLSNSVKIFSISVCAIAFLFSIIFFAIGLLPFENNSFASTFLIPASMPLFLYLICMFGFKIESQRTIKDFEKFFFVKSEKILQSS